MRAVSTRQFDWINSEPFMRGAPGALWPDRSIVTAKNVGRGHVWPLPQGANFRHGLPGIHEPQGGYSPFTPFGRAVMK